MRKRKRQEFKINYRHIPNAILLEQGFGILVEHFYRNQKKIKKEIKIKRILH